MDYSSSSHTPTAMHPISLKLDRTNYNFWKIQVLATARAYGFEDILLKSLNPPQFLDSTSANTDPITNPEYLTWLKRDQFMFSWILASISPPMMSYIGRCTTAAQIWRAFETLFHSQSKARATHLRHQLQVLRKGDSSIDEYILKFRDISDQLFNIGQEISDSDLISYILQGLSAEFESISVVLSSKCEELSLHEVQFALHTHELCLQTQAANPVQMQFQQANVATQQQQHQANVAYQRGRGRFGRGNRGRGGRFSGGNKPVCQLCEKPNHVAYKCYKRFDVSFTGPESLPPPPAQPQANMVNAVSPLNYYATTNPADFSSSAQVSRSPIADLAPQS